MTLRVKRRSESSISGSRQKAVIFLFLFIVCWSLIPYYVQTDLVYKRIESQWSELSDLPSRMQLKAQQNSHRPEPHQDHHLPEPHDNLRRDATTTFVPHFQRQEGVVLVTKIHGPQQYNLLAQSFCLLTKAYNDRIGYDIVVFTTVPLSEEEEKEVRGLVHPANLTMVIDTPGLQEEIAALSSERRQSFLERCNVKTPANLTWGSECPGRIAYNWQAEFRTVRVWRHPALAQYKYMMWIDSDTFSTKVWKQDPIAYMIAHDLVMFAGSLPGGYARIEEAERVHHGFNTNICRLSLTEDGYFNVETGHCTGKKFGVVNGFFHITNLDFYRSDVVINWLKFLREDCFLCREFDDQFAVTVPAAILAPNRSKAMLQSGIELHLFHNAKIDGVKQAAPAGFKRYFRTIQDNFTEATGFCPVTEAN
jgi:hypothetical protein